MLIGHQLRKHKSSKTNHNPQFSFKTMRIQMCIEYLALFLLYNIK